MPHGFPDRISTYIVGYRFLIVYETTKFKSLHREIEAADEGTVMTERSRGRFGISVAAEMLSMQVQNLRVYERRGLVDPDRTPGGTRLYSHDDLHQLARIRDLLADGLNLAGIDRVLTLEARVRRLENENDRLRRTERKTR